MIYTVTFNPSLDYTVAIHDFQLGKTNRTVKEQMFPGGKGINVSMVLKNLGIDSKALGFVAGFSGSEIVRLTREEGISCDFISLPDGYSRINVKMTDFDGTEINGLGPAVNDEAVEILMEKLEQLTEGDFLVLAGSIPASLPNSIYRDILDKLIGRGISFVVDAVKDLLLNVLPYKPFLIKPNNYELGDMFGVSIENPEDVEPYARKLQELGARNVLVSMAEKGAVLLDEHQNIHMLSAPHGTLVNAVGAGDSMVAGFLAGWIEQKDYDHAFKMGVAAGSASAYSEKLATGKEIDALYKKIQ